MLDSNISTRRSVKAAVSDLLATAKLSSYTVAMLTNVWGTVSLGKQRVDIARNAYNQGNLPHRCKLILLNMPIVEGPC